MLAESSVLVQFSLPTLLHGLLCVPTVWICNAILVREPGGYAALGGYTAASQFRTVVLQLPLLIQGVVWPALAQLFGAREMGRFGRLYQNTYELLWALGLLAAMPMILFGGTVMRVFGRAFVADERVLGLVMAVASLFLLSSFTGVALQVVNRTWPALYANVAYCSVSVLCAVVLVPRYGAMGLASAFVISTFVQTVSLLLIVRMMIPSHHRLANFGFAGLSVILCIGMQFLAHETSASMLGLRVLALAVCTAFVCWLGLLGPCRRLLRSLTEVTSTPCI